MRRCPRSRRMHPPPTRRARRPRVTASLLQPFDAPGGESNPFRAAPNPNSVLGARAALNLDSECPYWDAQRECLRMAADGVQAHSNACWLLLLHLVSSMRCKMRCESCSAFTATCIDTLGFGETRLNTVRFATGPKRSIRHLLGAKKNIFFNSRN